jgi:signal transduction histidine kinase
MENIAGLALAIMEKENRVECLSKATDFAEDLCQVKATFLANMSHEFRTPLNAIIGISSLLSLEENLNPEQKDLVDIVRNSGEELLTLIENILDYSRMQAGDIRLDSHPFNLHNCIESTLAMFTSAASAKGLHLSRRIDEHVPAIVIGDPRRLEQILRNLLENAIKFTIQGNVAIHVSSDNDYFVHFTVKDTGIGIPDDKRECLFESFSQVDDSLTRKYPGIGLGLAASRKLVELMGGQIWAESCEGVGSDFHFTIKAKRSSCQHMAYAVHAGSQRKNSNLL